MMRGDHPSHRAAVEIEPMTASVVRRRSLSRVAWCGLFAACAAAAVLASLRFGSNGLAGSDVVEVFRGAGSATARTIVMEQRIPRTLLGLLCGAALRVAGSLMQSLTRNPLAEPGLMGVNAGASVAVVLSVVLFGPQNIHVYMLAALGGAAVAGAGVFVLGRGETGSIVRLALAGVALSAALAAANQALVLSNRDAFDEFRLWVAGSLEGRDVTVVESIGPMVAVGLVLAVAVAPSINALALGEESGVALGVRLARTQTITLVSVALLTGAATAAMGPVAFVGLAVPFVVRRAVGNDVRWVNAGSLLLGPAWLLAADVLARVVIAPEETQVGIIATLAGGPLFIAMMSGRQVRSL